MLDKHPDSLAVLTAAPYLLRQAGKEKADPAQVRGWAAAMLRLLDDEAGRKAMVEAGLERARSLTPAESARRLLAAYRLAMR